jgi:hypothetical protein
MNALSIITQSGFNVFLNNDKLIVSPSSKLTNEQREYIKLHKAEIISELQREAEQRYFGFLITRPDGSQFFSYQVPFMDMREIRIQYAAASTIEPVTNEVYPDE